MVLTSMAPTSGVNSVLATRKVRSNVTIEMAITGKRTVAADVPNRVNIGM